MDYGEAQIILREQTVQARFRMIECAARIHQGFPGDMEPDGPFWTTVQKLEKYIEGGIDGAEEE